jgi:hypothetical protein
LSVDGDITATSADFGNITIAVADDNTISTTTGDLQLDSATNQVNVQGKLFVQSDLIVNDGTLKTNSGNVFLFNDPVATQADAFGYATTVGIGADTGTTTINNNLNVNDNLTVTGTTVNLAQTTNIKYSENNNRLNRPQVQSTTGNTSGFRVIAPNTGTSAGSSLSVNNSSDNPNILPMCLDQLIKKFPLEMVLQHTHI